MHFEFVTDTYPPDVNGAAKTIKHLVSCLGAAGHKVTVIGPNAGSSLPVFSVRVPKYSAVNIGFISASRLKAHWQYCRPDIIYIAGEAFLGFAAMKAASKLEIPVIAGYHTNFSQYAENWKLKFLAKPAIRHLRKFHNRATASVAPSSSVIEDLKKQDFNNLHLMGRGVDSAMFNPSKRSLDRRSEWGAKNDTPVALFASRISPEKNLTLLSQAFRQMQEINPDTRCVIVGDGPSYERFKRENPNVICYRFKHGEELAEIYASADIMVFPSVTETFGNTVTEALASGLVVVAYDYAAARMHIEHEVNGLVADYGNEQQFLQRCGQSIRLVFDNSLRSAANRSVINLTWDTVAQCLVDLSEELIEEQKKSIQ
jgi:glycosyltransferase involved in cell wall biosynthesis